MSEREVLYRHQTCGCPIYRDELPLSEWSCEHGHFFIAQPRKPPPPDGVIALGSDTP